MYTKIKQIDGLQNELDGKLLTTTFNTYTASTSDIYVTGGTYNATNKEIKLNRSDDNDVTIPFSGLTTMFDGIYSGSGLRVSSTNTWVDIPIDSEREKDSDYTHSIATNNSEVTINKKSRYLIIYSVSVKRVASSNNRTEGQTQLVLDEGSGWSTVRGTVRDLYIRTTNFGSSSSAQVVLDLNPGDKIKTQIQRTTGTGTFDVYSDGYDLTIIKLEGIEGEKGEREKKVMLVHH